MIEYYQSLGLIDASILILSSILLSLLLATSLYFLAGVQPLPKVRGGQRGRLRRAAASQGFFAALEPSLRYGGALVVVGLRRLRNLGPSFKDFESKLTRTLRKQLLHAGEPLGMDYRELIAASIMTGFMGAGLALLVGGQSGSNPWIAPAFFISLALPSVRIQAMGSSRLAEMSRELPGAIDLMAMAMNAGADFPGAMRQVVEGQKGVVVDELGQVLLALDLGITRASALVALRERAPVSDVRDLVRVVLLADKKGTSLSEALMQQARTSRLRRSERAEELAVKAGVWMLLPLMLLMLCVMILMVGPLVSTGGGL